ncbi:hypothetical protein VNO77_24620 [Canavalia gladiata]|uniref:Uncharacterized protein n=1 Tax=Canavalia gladiata TaxID=3824 RepID=A0AAN9QCQ9_CANGL
MDNRVKSKSEKSLCEKSMKVVVNMIRLSSFSIAQKTLGATTTTSIGKAEKDPSGSDYSDLEEPHAPVPFPSSKRSQKPQSRANPTYLFKSVGSNGSTSTGHVNPKEQCVDGSMSVTVIVVVQHTCVDKKIKCKKSSTSGSRIWLLNILIEVKKPSTQLIAKELIPLKGMAVAKWESLCSTSEPNLPQSPATNVNKTLHQGMMAAVTMSLPSSQVHMGIYPRHSHYRSDHVQ